MTRWFWEQVGGTLVEEFLLTPRSATLSNRWADGLILPEGPHRIAEAADVNVVGQEVIVVQTKTGRLRMTLGNIGGPIAGSTVARVVKEYAERIGLDPGGYSGHSLRAGFITECDNRGIGSTAVRLVTGHASDAMLNTYQRPRSLFESSAGAFFTDDD